MLSLYSRTLHPLREDPSGVYTRVGTLGPLSVLPITGGYQCGSALVMSLGIRVCYQNKKEPLCVTGQTENKRYHR